VASWKGGTREGRVVGKKGGGGRATVQKVLRAEKRPQIKVTEGGGRVGGGGHGCITLGNKTNEMWPLCDSPSERKRGKNVGRGEVRETK